MTRSRKTTLTAVVATATLWMAGGSARAETALDESDGEESAVHGKLQSAGQTLADRIPSVTRRVFVKAGRTELFAATGLSFNDPFYDHAIVGAGLSYHLLESLAIGFSGDSYLGRGKQLRVSGGQAASPTYDTPSFSARVEVSWAPIYGKLSLLAEEVLHFDTYLLLGAGVVGTSSSGTNPAGSVGLGQRYFASDWLAVRIEVRDQVFKMDRFPAGVGRAGSGWHSLLSVTVSACFYLPTTFAREAL